MIRLQELPVGECFFYENRNYILLEKSETIAVSKNGVGELRTLAINTSVRAVEQKVFARTEELHDAISRLRGR